MRVTRRRAAAGVALLALLAAAVALSPAAAVDRLRWALHSPWFPVVLVGLYAVRPLVAWPITLLSALVGYRYGVAVGVPVALVGAVATSLLPYAVGRRYGPSATGIAGRLADGSARFFGSVGGLRGVVAARLVPTPAEAISAAAGAGGVRLRAFVVGTAVGELPWTVAAVGVGASLGQFAVSPLGPDPALVAGSALLAALVLAGPLYRWSRGAEADAEAGV